MTIFNFLTLLGGLCLFLFGMNVMGNSLEKRAGGSLKSILSKITTGKMTGFLLGLGVTAIIQSSSATTVMVVGFVNSGLMTLRQAINVIMGANVGTTVTAWILSLTGIDSSNMLVQLFKPTSFTPILAAIGVGFLMFSKKSSKHDTGMILLGFATLMFGMETMTSSLSGLSDVPEFRQIMVMFTNPILGVLVGAVLTAIVQSSSASVGVLQALSATGQISFGAAIPIIMGQNIGTCVTALISSVGTNKNAKRAAIVHLMFNIFGTVVWLLVFCVANWIFNFTFVDSSVNEVSIAVIHSVFNILCTALMLPLSGWLEKLACAVIRDDDGGDRRSILDERLLNTPAVALAHCRKITCEMADTSIRSLKNALQSLHKLTPELADTIRKQEDEVDEYEDMIATYLVKLSNRPMSERDSADAAKLLHIIGDFERISDHAVNLLESAEELRDKAISFSPEAEKELSVIINALDEILSMAEKAFIDNDVPTAIRVEPLEQVVDTLKEQLRMRHILRMQKGACTIELGFIWSDLLTNLERVSDHCSNIACCVIEMSHGSLDVHEYARSIQFNDPDYINNYKYFANKYALVSDGDKKLVSPTVPPRDPRADD
jgi:phosphate:Na+ symporter